MCIESFFPRSATAQPGNWQLDAMTRTRAIGVWKPAVRGEHQQNLSKLPILCCQSVSRRPGVSLPETAARQQLGHRKENSEHEFSIEVANFELTPFGGGFAVWLLDSRRLRTASSGIQQE